MTLTHWDMVEKSIWKLTAQLSATIPPLPKAQMGLHGKAALHRHSQWQFVTYIYVKAL